MAALRHALVAVHSAIVSDPRVRRQIDWLTDAGWEVDTVGLGPVPTNRVRGHHPLADYRAWVLTRPGSVVTYALMSSPRAARILLRNRVPVVLRDAVRAGEYDLIVANDLEFVPWLADARTFGTTTVPRIHLDLHEVFTEYTNSTSLWGRLTSRYRRWVLTQVASPHFTTRSTVASAIAELYENELGIERPAVIRNSPEYVEQEPSDVDPSEIRMLYHGLADWTRGIREILEALPLLEKRFTMTFMLTGFPEVIEQVHQAAKPLGDRVRFVSPVPMPDIARAIKVYDLEIIFYRPTSSNLRYSLPNKLFEATQGRLGLVIGRSPMMQEVVKRYGNGIVVGEWGSESLATALNALDAEAVAALKRASHRAAADLNSETERLVFLATVGAESP